jgi:hypothetical protein
LPPITTKVTPSAMTPRIAEDRTTPKTLSMSMNRGFQSVNPTMNTMKATRMPWRARTPASDFIAVDFTAVSAIVSPPKPEAYPTLPVTRLSARPPAAGPRQTSVIPPSIITIWPVM